MSESTDELQQIILQLQRESQKVGLKMNMKKTKLIFNNYISENKIEIDEVIECVQEYIYLGQKIGSCPDPEKKSKE